MYSLKGMSVEYSYSEAIYLIGSGLAVALCGFLFHESLMGATKSTENIQDIIIGAFHNEDKLNTTANNVVDGISTRLV